MSSHRRRDEPIHLGTRFRRTKAARGKLVISSPESPRASGSRQAWRRPAWRPRWASRRRAAVSRCRRARAAGAGSRPAPASALQGAAAGSPRASRQLWQRRGCWRSGRRRRGLGARLRSRGRARRSRRGGRTRAGRHRGARAECRLPGADAGCAENAIRKLQLVFRHRQQPLGE